MMTHSDLPSDLRPGGEHRRSKRVRPGRLRVRLHRTCEGILVNISESGALVQVPSAMAPDRQVTVNLDIGETPFQLRGRVVRSSPHKLQMAEATLATPMRFSMRRVCRHSSRRDRLQTMRCSDYSMRRGLR